MKKLTLIIILLITGLTFGQQSKYFDAPFGGGGGFVPGWYIPKLDVVNEQLVNIGMPELSDNGFFTSGGAGFIYVGFVKQLRVGGMGFGGATSEEILINGVNRQVDYSIGGGGITIEYTLPFVKNVAFSIGGTIGAGSLVLSVYRNEDGYSWQGLWDEVNQPTSDNVSRELTNNYWFFSPTFNIDYPVYRFVSLRLGVGYQLTFGGDWTVDNDQTISDVPSDFNGDSFFIQSGIFVGFFSY